MRRLFSLCPRLHLWLAASLLPMLLFLLTRSHRPLMTLWTQKASRPLRTALASVFDPIPFAVGEWLALAVMAAVPLWLLLTLWRLRTPGGRLAALYRSVLFLLCSAATIGSGFCLLWGPDYYVDGFAQQARLEARPISLEQLTAVTDHFAQELSAAAEGLPWGADGHLQADAQEILSASADVYENAALLYPFLDSSPAPPKALACSRLLSRMNYTGFYFPFTGEANVNVDAPRSLLASTCAHELAHKMGYALEQECNFLAILACTTSDDPVFRYAGYLSGYIYLGNALYEADRELWYAMRMSLSPSVQRDLAAHNAYWAQFDGPTAKVADKVYDGFLKSYGNEAGIRSYGMVVDLLVAYYQ